jgi:hypothetical protein
MNENLQIVVCIFLSEDKNLSLFVSLGVLLFLIIYKTKVFVFYFETTMTMYLIKPLYIAKYFFLSFSLLSLSLSFLARMYLFSLVYKIKKKDDVLVLPICLFPL